MPVLSKTMLIATVLAHSAAAQTLDVTNTPVDVYVEGEVGPYDGYILSVMYVILGGVLAVMGQSVKREMYFAVGFAGGALGVNALVQWIEGRWFLIGSVPHVALMGLGAVILALLAARYHRFSTMLVGAAAGGVSGAFLWQVLSTLEVFEEYAALPGAQWVTVGVCALIGSGLMALAIDVMLCISTSFVGSYLVVAGAAEIVELAADVEVFPFAPEVMFTTPKAVLDTKNGVFYGMLGLWAVLTVIAAVVQVRRLRRLEREGKTRRQEVVMC